MHVRTLRVSTLHQVCALIVRPAAFACGSDDPFPGADGAAPAPAPAAPAGPSPTPSTDNPAATPPTPGVTPTPATPPGTSNEGMGPIDLTPPSDDGADGEQTGGDGDEPAGEQPPAPSIPTVPVGGGACPEPAGLITMLQAFA